MGSSVAAPESQIKREARVSWQSDAREVGITAPVCQASGYIVGLLLGRGFVYESSMMAKRNRGAVIRAERFPYYTERQQ